MKNYSVAEHVIKASEDKLYENELEIQEKLKGKNSNTLFYSEQTNKRWRQREYRSRAMVVGTLAELAMDKQPLAFKIDAANDAGSIGIQHEVTTQTLTWLDEVAKITYDMTNYRDKPTHTTTLIHPLSVAPLIFTTEPQNICCIPDDEYIYNLGKITSWRYYIKTMELFQRNRTIRTLTGECQKLLDLPEAIHNEDRFKIKRELTKSLPDGSSIELTEAFYQKNIPSYTLTSKVNTGKTKSYQIDENGCEVMGGWWHDPPFEEQVAILQDLLTKLRADTEKSAS